ncbi:MAG: acylphosphatase [Methanomicrobiaceae archaeon]|nr:acylphosphatase [Methanomicrobiaceae archaeon]
MQSTIEILVSGRVQKVGFRACIRKIASNLGINGTVSNMEDGRVRIIAAGETVILEKFLSMIYGCPRATIRDLKVAWLEKKDFEGFSILRNSD